jgi:hypothetical protein
MGNDGVEAGPSEPLGPGARTRAVAQRQGASA